MRTLKVVVWIILLVGGVSFARSVAAEGPPPAAPKLPAGFVIAPGSVSPDGQYGVSVYDNTVNPVYGEPEDSTNQVINLRTGQVVGTLLARTADIHMSHGEILPCRWSSDSSLLLWEVTGKWCDWALNLVHLRGNHIVWQTNLLLDTQRAILERTHRANPNGYLAAMKENKAGRDNKLGSGISVFPDGFAVDVSVDAPERRHLTLPLKATASLTSEPKPGFLPGEANVNALLEAVVDEGGRLRVTSFRTAKEKFPPF